MAELCFVMQILSNIRLQSWWTKIKRVLGEIYQSRIWLRLQWWQQVCTYWPYPSRLSSWWTRIPCKPKVRAKRKKSEQKSKDHRGAYDRVTWIDQGWTRWGDSLIKMRITLRNREVILSNRGFCQMSGESLTCENRLTLIDRTQVRTRLQTTQTATRTCMTL